MIITIKIKANGTTLRIKKGEKVVKWSELKFSEQLNLYYMFRSEARKLLKTINNE